MIDSIDKKILSILKNNCKVSNQELAEMVGLSPSPCLRRVKALEEEGYILGYVAQLNNRALGLGVRSMIFVTLTSRESEFMQSFEQSVLAYEEVLECYLIAGQSHDYMLSVITQDLESYHIFLMEKLTQVPGVVNVQSNFVLRSVHETRYTDFE